MSRADLEVLGFNTNLLDNPKTGFSAEVYHNAVTDEMVLAYEGTKIDSVEDWKANFGQGVGLPMEQYQQAEQAADEFDETFAEYNRAITGHSLGGGLAAYGSLATGINAVTFNAAGLHENSLERVGMTREQAQELVTAYNVGGDILNMVQDSKVADFAAAAVIQSSEMHPRAIEYGIMGDFGTFNSDPTQSDVLPEAVGTRRQHAARTSSWDVPDWSGNLKADMEQALDLHSIEAQIHTLWSEYARRRGQ